ncbi:glycosyltransferase [Bacillus sp. HNG]|uniref:glycosyltransferase family 4 protein n=1 Tax=Bacillus sp. HNG TaxID=2293325 RepID=UPI000E2F18F3|nr:glycosyltransferase family 4 protein [Bacillus sp. HNG]RFB18193.1 glycosyltransferase [Bacillus sp. HNG]
MKVLVIWRLLTVGGVNAGWRNRAVYFKKYGIQTDFMYVKDLGGMHIMEDVANVFLTSDEKEIIEIIQKNNYDVIIVCDTKKGYKWIRKAKFKGPVLIEARTPEIIKLNRHLPDFDYVQPERIIVPSVHQKRLTSILIDSKAPYEVIFNGIDTEFFKPLSPKDTHLNIEPIPSEGKKVVAYIGRLDGRKNWKLLMEIAHLIKNERVDIEIWIIGGANSVQRDEFEDYWYENSLTDIVKWYPVVPYHEMPHMYSKVKQSGGCTIATTKGESFGNTFIESMACGVPVVAPGISSIPEIIEDGKTGLLYKEENAREAVNKIYQIMEAPEYYQILSDNARERVESCFSISVCAETYVRLLQELHGGARHSTN